MPKRQPDNEAPEFGKRLVALLHANGIPRRGAGAYLQRLYKVSNVTANDWLNGKFRPEIDTAKCIAEDHGSTFDELYFGDSRRTSSARVAQVREIETGSSDSFRIDLIAAEADMGDGRVNEDFPEVIRAVEFPPDYIRSVVGYLPPPGRLVLVTGRGDSMVPVIQPGDSVIVDTGVASYDGDGLYLVNLGHGQQIKRLIDHGKDAGVYAHSDNKAYPERKLPKGAIVGGKVYLRARVDRFN